MQTVFYFVRHAQPNYDNHDDMTRELTEQGMSDRRFVTRFLEDKNIDIVLSSPYKRSVDTVKEFADKHNLEIHLVEDFRERKIDDVWIEDFNAFSKKQWTDFNFKLHGGESLLEVQERNIGALELALQKYSGKNIVVGSHGTALSVIIHYFDHTFGYKEFCDVKGLMPWIVKIVFDEGACVEIEKMDCSRQSNL